MKNWIVLCLMFAFATPVVAQESQASAPAQDSEGKRQARAKAMWDEGSRRYDAGKWAQAITLYTEAYEVWPYPEILFNLCQSYRQEKDYERALFYCKSYLRNKPDAKNAAAVNRLIDEMTSIVDKQQASNDKPPKDVAWPPGFTPEKAPLPKRFVGNVGNTTKPKRWYGSASGWAALGVSVAALGTGAYLLHIDGTQTGCPPDAHILCKYTWDTHDGAFALFGVGMASAALSVYLFQSHEAVVVEKHTAMVVVSGEF